MTLVIRIRKFSQSITKHLPGFTNFFYFSFMCIFLIELNKNKVLMSVMCDAGRFIDIVGSQICSKLSLSIINTGQVGFQSALNSFFLDESCLLSSLNICQSQFRRQKFLIPCYFNLLIENNKKKF